MVQVGPRLELEVVKVEEGLCQGKVLHHSWVSKSPAEAVQQESAVAEGRSREELREKRRKQQVSMRNSSKAGPHRVEQRPSADSAIMRWGETVQAAPGGAQPAP